MRWRELLEEMKSWEEDALDQDVWVSLEEEQQDGLEAMRTVQWTAQCLDITPSRRFLLAGRCGPREKVFKIVSVSANTNEYGLNHHIFISRDGHAWQADAYRGPDGKTCKKGDVLAVPWEDGVPQFSKAGYEMAAPIGAGKAPVQVVREVWGEDGLV